MRVNPTLVKQYARQVDPLGMVLWRQVVAAGSTAGSSSGGGRLMLAPAQIRQQLGTFAAQGDANKQFVELADNRNLANHVGVLCQLLTCHDDPLTISGSELTDRWGCPVERRHALRDAVGRQATPHLRSPLHTRQRHQGKAVLTPPTCALSSTWLTRPCVHALAGL